MARCFSYELLQTIPPSPEQFITAAIEALRTNPELKEMMITAYRQLLAPHQQSHQVITRTRAGAIYQDVVAQSVELLHSLRNGLATKPVEQMTLKELALIYKNYHTKHH